jgi:hypothetical protein
MPSTPVLFLVYCVTTDWNVVVTSLFTSNPFHSWHFSALQVAHFELILVKLHKFAILSLKTRKPKIKGVFN